jgi:hypothetical protein
VSTTTPTETLREFLDARDTFIAEWRGRITPQPDRRSLEEATMFAG